MDVTLPHHRPFEICAEDGHVIIDGPGGVALTLTSEAAVETSDRLLEAGAQAHGQKLDKDQSGG